MAKTKKVKSKPALVSVFKPVVLFILLILLIIFSLSQLNSTNLITQNNIANTQTQATKISTPSAKLNPTPTPEPQYTGFCLKVPILLYHHVKSLESAKNDGQASLTVDTNMFDAQMQYLISQGFHTISVDELANALINHQPLPLKSIVITLDDGYEDIYSNAYPILYKYQLKANLMIATGLLGNPGYMNWDELKRMVDTGLIFAYDHSWSHAALVNLPDEKIRHEILTGKIQLEEKLGKEVFIFAYPYGLENQHIVNILKENGFRVALSTIPGFIQCDSFIMSLHRTRVGNAPLSQYGI